MNMQEVPDEVRKLFELEVEKLYDNERYKPDAAKKRLEREWKIHLQREDNYRNGITQSNFEWFVRGYFTNSMD